MMQPIKIYVGNVPTSARNSELKELFEKFGKVIECDILKEFAFVHMDDTNDAKAAIAGLNDSLWKGGRIRVELSTTKTNKGEPSKREFPRGGGSMGGSGGDMMMRGGGVPRRGGFGGPDRNGPPKMTRGGGRGGRGGGPGFDRGDSRRGGRDMRPMSRGGGQHMMRDGPFENGDRFPRRQDNSGGGGPIRDGRFNGPGGGQHNGRPFYMPERNRPYPDQFEGPHRGGRASSRGGFGGEPNYGQNQMPSGPPFRGGLPGNGDFRGPPNEFYNRPDHRQGPNSAPGLNGFNNPGFNNPFPNQPMSNYHQIPPMHNEFFRGPPMPSGMPVPPQLAASSGHLGSAQR